MNWKTGKMNDLKLTNRRQQARYGREAGRMDERKRERRMREGKKKRRAKLEDKQSE